MAKEFDEVPCIVTQVQAFVRQVEPDAPLLHGQGAEQNFDRPALFVLADLVDDVGMKVHRASLHLGNDQADLSNSVFSPAQRGRAWRGQVSSLESARGSVD